MLCYAKSLQSCPTLCNPIDGSPPGSAFSGILQARILEWVAISFSNAWKWKVKVKLFSGARLLATPWTAAHQAPPSMGFAKQEYWSGVPLPSPMFQSTLQSHSYSSCYYQLESSRNDHILFSIACVCVNSQLCNFWKSIYDRINLSNYLHIPLHRNITLQNQWTSFYHKTTHEQK